MSAVAPDTRCARCGEPRELVFRMQLAAGEAPRSVCAACGLALVDAALALNTPDTGCAPSDVAREGHDG